MIKDLQLHTNNNPCFDLFPGFFCSFTSPGGLIATPRGMVSSTIRWFFCRWPRRSKQRCAVCRRGKGWGHRAFWGQRRIFLHPWMDIFQEDFAAIFGKMIRHHRTVMWFKCWSWKKFCTSFNMENLPFTLGLCISVGFLWCFSTFLESLESLFTGIGTSEGFCQALERNDHSEDVKRFICCWFIQNPDKNKF